MLMLSKTGEVIIALTFIGNCPIKIDEGPSNVIFWVILGSIELVLVILLT